MSDESTFENALSALWGSLAILHEQEQPIELGPAAASYVEDEVGPLAERAVEAGRELLNVVSFDQDPPEYREALNLCEVAAELAVLGKPTLSSLRGLYELLNVALERIDVQRAHESIGLAGAPPQQEDPQEPEDDPATGEQAGPRTGNPIDPRDLASAVRGYVETLIKLVEPLTSADEGEMAGYFELGRDAVGEVRERLTESGVRLAESAAAMGRDIAARVRQSTGYQPPSTPAPLNDLDYEAAFTLAMVAAALAGLRTAADPLYVAVGMMQALRPLAERARQAEEVEVPRAAPEPSAGSEAPVEPVHRLTSAVFHLTHPIDAIGGKVGDAIVIRPNAAHGRRALMQRPIDPSWAFGPHATLSWWESTDMSADDVHRELRERMGAAPQEPEPSAEAKLEPVSQRVTPGNTPAAETPRLGDHAHQIETIDHYGHLLVSIAAAVSGANRGDSGLMALLRDRATTASAFVWAVETQTKAGEEPPPWHAIGSSVVYDLPLLVIAAGRAVEDPDRPPFPGAGEAWWWCQHHADRLGEAMMEWAEKHGGAEASDA
jgi:hypothetical protein